MKTAPPSKRRATAAKAKPLRRARTPAAKDGSAQRVPRLPGIRHILVPLDFSDSAEKALRYAVSFARQFDAKITLLHVRPIPLYPTGIGEVPSVALIYEPSPDQIKARLVHDSRRLVPREMCERTTVRQGAAYDEICAVALEFAADLIIIATHGRTGLKRAVLGSTAERVVRHAPCPVLVVREREREFA